MPYVMGMPHETELARTAYLFKVLGSESRLKLLIALGHGPRSVGQLVRDCGLSQPLVSSHLHTLRHAGLVASHREGKQVVYSVTDGHVGTVISQGFTHAQEPDA